VADRRYVLDRLAFGRAQSHAVELTRPHLFIPCDHINRVLSRVCFGLTNARDGWVGHRFLFIRTGIIPFGFPRFFYSEIVFTSTFRRPPSWFTRPFSRPSYSLYNVSEAALHERRISYLKVSTFPIPRSTSEQSI